MSRFSFCRSINYDTAADNSRKRLDSLRGFLTPHTKFPAHAQRTIDSLKEENIEENISVKIHTQFRQINIIASSAMNEKY